MEKKNMPLFDDPFLFDPANPHAEAREVDLLAAMRENIKLPDQIDQLDDSDVSDLSSQLLFQLARFHLCLEDTDHMDDRELCHFILNKVCQEPIKFAGDGENLLIHHECINPFDHTETWLAYYADGHDREEWRHELDGRPMPEPRPMKADRDNQIKTLCERFRKEPIPVLKKG